MSVKTPCSTAPNSESCCDLLKRWISSMNSSGAFWSKNRCLRADSITSRTSFTPDVTAERVKNGRSNCVATIFASVVLPTPGGPQRMNDGTLPVSKNLRNTPFLPTRCSCPIYSSIVRGRSRSAKGAGIGLSFSGLPGKNGAYSGFTSDRYSSSSCVWSM